MKPSEKIYGLIKGRLNYTKTLDQVRRLNTVSLPEAKKLCDELYIRRIKNSVLALLVTAVLVVFAALQNVLSDHELVISRGDYGQEPVTKTVWTKVDGKEESFDTLVEPISYRADEIDRVMDEAFEYIDSVYLGDNSSADEVTADLNLIDEIEDSGLSVTWISDNYEVITPDGTLLKYEDGSPELVELNAQVCYGDYCKERNYEIRVTGRKKTDKERIFDSISDYIARLQRDNPSERELKLPPKILGYEVRDNSDKTSPVLIFLLGLICVTGIWVLDKSKLKNQEDQRNQLLLLDYPVLIEELILYIEAGLTVRRALMKIAEKNGRQFSKGSVLHLELSYILNEMKSGKPETDCYYLLGQRLHLPVYIRFASLLSQNVKKGTRDLISMLEMESQEAVEQRIELAKRRGEEAGTKLLVPMTILMIVVMIIVIFPALTSF